MMEYLRGFPDDVVAMIWHDKRSDNDCRRALDPASRDRLAGKHDVRLLARYVDRTRRLAAHADLDDLMRGVGQWQDFARIAVVTDERTVRHAVQFFGPFFHGPIRVFSNAQSAEARARLRKREYAETIRPGYENAGKRRSARDPSFRRPVARSCAMPLDSNDARALYRAMPALTPAPGGATVCARDGACRRVDIEEARRIFRSGDSSSRTRRSSRAA